MAVYTGKVNLINMSNITATAGVGIQSTRILYTTSSSGTVPPDLEGVELVTIDGDILDFASTGSSFHVINEVLWAQQGESQVALQLDGDLITGFKDWETTVPTVKPGEYLWSKTIYTYTDGKQTVTYAVSRQGADGKPGPAGSSSSSYKLDFSQTEILKFVDSNGTTTISPAILTVSVLKDEPLELNGATQITDLDISEFEVSIYNLNTGEWYPITDPDIVTLEETHNFNINLQTLINKGSEEGNLAANQLLFNECILKVSYSLYLEKEEEIERFNMIECLNVRYGMNKDMASLSVKAGGIVASMQDSKLTFDANGLVIQNGAFIIRDEANNNLLYSDNGNLSLKGTIYADNGYFSGELRAATGTFTGELQAASGTFTGRLEAATGSFSGDISAAGGTIGGFTIGPTRLTSTSINENGLFNIVLDGGEGRIEAENIILGTGAEIREYIKIGEQVELRKAVTSNDSFIKVINEEEIEILSLKANGTMNLGNGNNTIILSGEDGSIMSQSYRDGLGWKISNTNSIFNDVTVRGSIRASVLEYGETQAIGGALMIRPSSRIIAASLSETNTILTIEEVKGFNIGDFCRIDIQTLNSLDHNFYEIVAVDQNNKTITVSGNAADTQGKPIVNFGQTGDNVGICINGSVDDSFGTPQSISVFDFDTETKLVSPRIVLGKLPNEQTIYGYAAGTYGLYAENVLLKGSLVTQTDTTGSVTYSGISTLYSGIDAPASHKYESWFGTGNTGEILLWAGATGTTKEEVENSKFFVDRNGNLFAGSGYFKGTIITDATITASAIETAILRGSNDKPGEPALKIEDATKGIVFTATNEYNETEVVFEVTKDQIVANVPNFKFNSNFTVGGNGSLVVPNLYVIGSDDGTVITEEIVTEAIMFDNKRISYTKDFKQNELNGNTKGYIDFANGTVFSPDGVNQVLTLSSQQVHVNMPLYIQESIKYNEVMEYKPAYDSKGELVGYDLYIE